MTHDTTCNGWSNYATWRINLEICDDIVRSIQEDVEEGDREPFDSTRTLADYLEEATDDTLTGYGQIENENSYTDLALSYARAFISNVDFYEIAETAIADCPALIAKDEED